MTPGTAKHVLHHREHEAFFVLEGEVSVTVAGQQRSLRTGSETSQSSIQEVEILRSPAATSE